MRAEVIKLDRGYPLVRTHDGELFRCEHATALIKGENKRAVIGDQVEIDLPQQHDKAKITHIYNRKNVFVRKDPTERALPQVMAANFDQVILVQPIGDVQLKRLERELVLAYETRARVALILTKSDTLEDADRVRQRVQEIKDVVGSIPVIATAQNDQSALEAVRSLLPVGTTSILIGRSGVGKSTLINALAGEDLQETQAVREGDGKGRHTTVSREIISLSNAGRVVDMPGVRGLGLWDAEEGMALAFADITQLAQECRFRDCEHVHEPGCRVQEAIEQGRLSSERLASYRALQEEISSIAEKREEARRMRNKGGRRR